MHYMYSIQSNTGAVSDWVYMCFTCGVGPLHVVYHGYVNIVVIFVLCTSSVVTVYWNITHKILHQSGVTEQSNGSKWWIAIVL